MLRHATRTGVLPAHTDPIDYFSALYRGGCGRAPSSPSRFRLSASYSW
jgi:hypothetical protein